MACPSYLARRGDGRYFLQMRLGKRAASLFQLPLLRVSLRTGDYDEARRRLVDNLGWVLELIEAPDLESFGIVVEARLLAHVERGSPADERSLAERCCAFEHEVRHYLTRARERGYAYQVRFPRMPSLWVDFVNQNKLAEGNIKRLAVRRSYEIGRVDAAETASEGWAVGFAGATLLVFCTSHTAALAMVSMSATTCSASVTASLHRCRTHRPPRDPREAAASPSGP
jgi:hypothetical protein